MSKPTNILIARTPEGHFDVLATDHKVNVTFLQEREDSTGDALKPGNFDFVNTYDVKNLEKAGPDNAESIDKFVMQVKEFAFARSVQEAGESYDFYAEEPAQDDDRCGDPECDICYPEDQGFSSPPEVGEPKDGCPETEPVAPRRRFLVYFKDGSVATIVEADTFDVTTNPAFVHFYNEDRRDHFTVAMFRLVELAGWVEA